MKNYFLTFLGIFILNLVYSQPIGMKGYTFSTDTIPKKGERIIVSMDNSDRNDSTIIYWFSNEITEEGINQTILELEKILGENNVDKFQPKYIESSFPEHIDNFDAKAIAKYLLKKKKDFSLGYELPDENSKIIWVLTYSVNGNEAELKCVNKEYYGE